MLWYNGANFCNIERHTGCGRGCGSDGKSGRLQWGVTNSGPTSDMRATIRIPNNFRVPDTLTLQLGGSQHSGSCKSVQGYKAYIGIKGGKNGVGIETGSCKHKVYPDDFPNSNKAPLFTLSQAIHTILEALRKILLMEFVYQPMRKKVMARSHWSLKL